MPRPVWLCRATAGNSYAPYCATLNAFDKTKKVLLQKTLDFILYRYILDYMKKTPEKKLKFQEGELLTIKVDWRLHSHLKRLARANGYSIERLIARAFGCEDLIFNTIKSNDNAGRKK